MGDEQDIAFGEAAIERGFITRQQLEECMRVAEMVTQAGLTRSLADILVEKSFITGMQAEVLGRATAGVGDVKVIGGFELVEKIGEGGMGAVYKARQISMDRVVALKILPDRLARDKEFTARFLREARIAAKLDHVNMVRGIDVGQDGEYYYFAMEFVEGESVADVLKRDGAMPEERTLRIGIQIARALDHAWGMQLIHRDIKPDNVLLTGNDVAKVADFGLARSTSADSTVMTRTGMAVGTPHYISPEQARGEKDIDIRTDIYSLGATLYHMAVGDTPFSGSTAAVIVTQHLTETAPPAHLRNAAVSENTSRVIAKMMAKNVEDRYTDPKQLLEDLETVADGQEPVHAAVVVPPPSAVPTVGPGASGVSFMSEAELRQFQSQVVQAAARRWLAPALIVGSVLVVGLAALAFFLLTRGAGEEPTARRDLAAIRSLIGAGKLDSALERALVGVDVYAGTKSAESFSALVEEIKAKQKDLADAKLAEEAAAKEKMRREALLKEARTALDRAAALLGENRFDEARAALRESAPKIKEAGLEKEMEELAGKIAAAERAVGTLAGAERTAREKRETERRAAEAAREKDFADRVALGDRRFAERDFAGALESYQAAAEIKSTPGLERKIEDCRFEAAVAKGKAAQDREELAAAAEWYRKALAVREDAAVRARLEGVVDLLRKRELAKLLAEARGVDPEKATDADEIRKALEAAKKALSLAGEKEAAELEARARDLEAALSYRIAIEDARAAIDASEWDRAKRAALRALEARLRDLEAAGILARARVEIGRPKEVTGRVGMKMLWVPGGAFKMGSGAADPDERPVRTVRVKGFYIGRTEVTNAQYEGFDPQHAKKRGRYSKAPNDPVVRVGWNQAAAFCRWLSKNEGKRYRLPTEAEWEYAARGNTDRIYPWGDEAPAAGGVFRANFGEGKSKASWARDGFAYVAPVGSFPASASPFGCLDMAGNVWEWCSDWYGPYQALDQATDQAGKGVVDSPTGPRKGTERVIRGGSWYHDADSLHVTNRWSKKPSRMSSSTGFRCVMEAE